MAAGDVGETADGRDGRRRGVRHLKAREEARHMQWDVRRDGRHKGGELTDRPGGTAGRPAASSKIGDDAQNGMKTMP